MEEADQSRGGDSVRQVQIQSVDLDAHGGPQVLSDASLMSSMPAPCGHCHFRRYINAIKGKPSSANVNYCSANVIVAYFAFQAMSVTLP